MQQKPARRRQGAARSTTSPRLTVDFDPDTTARLQARAAAQGNRSVASVIREAVAFALRHPEFAEAA